MAQTDEQLVEKIQKGDVFAFEEIVKRYQSKLLRFARQIVSDDADAQEIVQDSFLKIYQTIDRADLKKKFSSYIYAIVRNTAISYLRKRKVTISIEKIENLLPLHEVDFYENLIDIEEYNWVQKALGFLSIKHREALKLYYFEELSYEEISQKMLIPLNTVRTYLNRGKEQLGRILVSKSIKQ